jgi:hypothetical protein
MLMHKLEKFYLEKIVTLDQKERFTALLHIDDVLVINFDCLYDREGTLRALDQIIYLCHDHGRGKQFIFISEDGANIRLSGALTVIASTIDCFSLDETNCLVVCREQITIPNATVITNESIPFWCQTLYHTIKDVPIPQGPFKKKFAVWFHRGTFWRTAITRHLVENYKKDSYISYQEPGILIDKQLSKFFNYNVDWAMNNTPIIYDELFPNRVFDFELIVGASRKPYADYFIEIVAETDILTTDWITEKTVKNLYIGKPFIVFGAPKTLIKIKSFGFQTFSPWIDESYDLIDNIHLRLEAIKKEIDRLSSYSLEELHQIQQQLLPILEHNRQTYGKYITSR